MDRYYKHKWVMHCSAFWWSARKGYSLVLELSWSHKWHITVHGISLHDELARDKKAQPQSRHMSLRNVTANCQSTIQVSSCFWRQHQPKTIDSICNKRHKELLCTVWGVGWCSVKHTAIWLLGNALMALDLLRKPEWI